jgi:hypothetical protein
MRYKRGYFLPAGTHLPYRVTGMGKTCTRSRVWVRLKATGTGMGWLYAYPYPAGAIMYLVLWATMSNSLQQIPQPRPR